MNQGIAADRMSTISYDETRLAMPEIPTPKNKDSPEAKENRRVHFEVIVKYICKGTKISGRKNGRTSLHLRNKY